MRQMSKLLLTIIIFNICLMPTQSFGQVSISVVNVEGVSGDKIRPDVPIVFSLRWTNNTDTLITFSNGFRMYLKNNIELPAGQFQPMTLDTLPVGFSNMFKFFQFRYFSVDGLGSDSVAMFGDRLFSHPGLPIGFDEVANLITTSVTSDFAGDTLCLDSVRIDNLFWVWYFNTSRKDNPTWSGPHCYEILPSCCVGIRGNVDLSSDEGVDISDLVMLVGFVFTNGTEPYCSIESDVTADGEVDISDLVSLVDFIFTNGPPPPACP